MVDLHKFSSSRSFLSSSVLEFSDFPHLPILTPSITRPLEFALLPTFSNSPFFTPPDATFINCVALNLFRHESVVRDHSPSFNVDASWVSQT